MSFALSWDRMPVITLAASSPMSRMIAASLSFSSHRSAFSSREAVIAGISAWLAQRYFEHTRLKATRRQFARLGFGELANFMPDPDSPESSADAAERVAQANETGEPIKKGLGVDVTPP